MYYAPPGAQVLRTNPLFVRSHDFIGIQGANQTWGYTYVPGSGWPSNAGGRLAGSLASLPYALAEAEQNFLIPSREQALIWGDLVPQIMLTAIVPRWWNVSPVQIHWVGVHMAYGESLLGQAALNAERRRQVIAALEPYLAPGRLRKIDDLLQSGEPRMAVENVLPSEMYLLARSLAGQDRESPLAQEIRRLAAESPADAQPGGDLAGVRHSQADAGEYLRLGIAESPHLPDSDGILQPDPGGELGVEPAVLRGAGGRRSMRSPRK